jgi:hypothetical protein
MKIVFIREKSCRVPTLWGWLVLCIMCAGLVFLAAKQLDSFLSVNNPVDAKVMVVEGWLPDYAVRQALNEFNRTKAVKLITTGGPLEKGYYLSEYKTYAELTRETLKKIGADSTAIVMIPAPEVKVDRTYASACEVKKWIERSGMSLTAINLVSMGPHTRRSRLLYEKAFDAPPKLSVTVGTIACSEQMYDGRSWWKTSSGFRIVTDELIAYLYARFVFRRK